MKNIVLVYQAKMANVLEVESFNLADYGRDAKLLTRNSFSSCENYAQSRHEAGDIVMIFACDMPGNVTHLKWSDDLEGQSFSDNFRWYDCHALSHDKSFRH